MGHYKYCNMTVKIKTMAYTGYELTSSSRDLLHRLYPPTNPTWLGHHITELFGVSDDEPAPDAPQSVYAVGYINVDGIDGFVVEVDGSSKRPDGKVYHITWSINKSKGIKPMHTNNVVHKAAPIDPIQLDVVPKTFTKSTESHLKENQTFLDFLYDNYTILT